MKKKQLAVILIVLIWISPAYSSFIFLKSYDLNENARQGDNVLWKFDVSTNELENIKKYENSFIRGISSLNNEISFMTYNPDSSNGNFTITNFELNNPDDDNSHNIGKYINTGEYILLDGLIHLDEQNKMAAIWKQGSKFLEEEDYIVVFNRSKIIDKLLITSEYPYLAPHSISMYTNSTILMVVSLLAEEITSDHGKYIGIFSNNGTLLELIELEQVVKSVAYDPYNQRFITISQDLHTIHFRNVNWGIVKEVNVDERLYEIAVHSESIVIFKAYYSLDLRKLGSSLLILLSPLGILIFISNRKEKSKNSIQFKSYF